MKIKTEGTYSRIAAQYLRERWLGQDERIQAIVQDIQAGEDWTKHLLASDEHGWDDLPLLDTCPRKFKYRMQAAPRDLRGLVFSNLDLSHTEGLADSCLDWCTFRGVSLDDASLTGASLCCANFLGSDCSLDRAILEYADLQNADMTNVSLEEADLKEANIRGTNFEQAILLGANLQGVKYTEEPTLGFVLYAMAFLGNKLRQIHAQRDILGFENGPFHLPWTRFGGSLQSPNLLDARTSSSMLEYIAGENLGWSFWRQHWLLALVWYLLANFGRSVRRLIIWILVLWLFFSILYAGCLPSFFKGTRLGIFLDWLHPQIDWKPPLARWDSRPFYASAATMLSLGFGDVALELKDWKAQVAVCLEALSGYILLAMFMTVLLQKSGASIGAAPSILQREPALSTPEKRTTRAMPTLISVEAASIPDSSDWHTVWQELRGNAARQFRVQTLVKKVTNEIITVDEEGITVKSSQTERKRFIPSAQFEVVWHHLTARGSVLLNEIPKIEHGRVVLAIFVAFLPERVRVVGQNTIQVHR